MPLLVVAPLVLGLPLALAGTSCLGYLDKNDSWHPGFSCQPFSFCCGTCHHRFCCRDLSLFISESWQKHCLGFSPRVLAAITSAVTLFVAVVATALCCFCTSRYLTRRRRQLHSPFAGQEVAMTGSPVPAVCLYPQHPFYLAGPPVPSPAAPPPYTPPRPAYPGA